MARRPGPASPTRRSRSTRKRDYTIVVSLPQDRPKNATDKCGVAWMNWGTAGDGYTRPDSTMLLLRNLTTTAHPAFPNAVQNIATPSTVKSTMGAYLPTVKLHRRGEVPAHRVQGQHPVNNI